MEFSKGLEGVIADETKISDVEGDIGRLSYRGYAIEELADLDYITVMWLVLFGELPSDAEAAELASFLSAQGRLNDGEETILKSLPRSLHPMRMLQSMIPVLDYDPAIDFRGMGEEASRGLTIIAKLPTLIASFRQVTKGSPLATYRADLEYLANFLTMFTGTENAAHVDVLRVVQILQMEHSFNAGTFTSRVVASTLAPVDSVFSAAVGALFGILHGGADEAALLDAQKVGSPNAAPGYVGDLLANKGKLMGMGHREYRKVDPRAVILKPIAERLCRGTQFQNDYDTLFALERAFNEEMQSRGKEIWANLEFYKGPVYEAIGIPPHYFTATFAMSRCVGWLAHFLESREDNRIMRPKAAYVGEGHRSLAGA